MLPPVTYGFHNLCELRIGGENSGQLIARVEDLWFKNEGDFGGSSQ
jgi:hypothetical protein